MHSKPQEEKEPAVEIEVINLETEEISREPVKQVSIEELERLERRGRIHLPREDR